MYANMKPHAAILTLRLCCQVFDDLHKDVLRTAVVRVSHHARKQLEECWASPDALRQELYPSFEEWLALVEQVLQRDIRSVHQRLRSCPDSSREPDAAQQPRLGASLSAQGAGASHLAEDGMSEGRTGACDEPTCVVDENSHPVYQVVLQGVRVWYDITAAKYVDVRGAQLS